MSKVHDLAARLEKEWNRHRKLLVSFTALIVKQIDEGNIEGARDTAMTLLVSFEGVGEE
mgnify:CR=1 FL=1|tara:strand:+ start:2249 stop:2425 length:177 start_codon:yes stop_codon:yes gene_type:complete